MSKKKPKISKPIGDRFGIQKPTYMMVSPDSKNSWYDEPAIQARLA